jgi:hypothetical protein
MSSVYLQHKLQRMPVSCARSTYTRSAILTQSCLCYDRSLSFPFYVSSIYAEMLMNASPAYNESPLVASDFIIFNVTVPGLESREYGRTDPSRCPRGTLYKRWSVDEALVYIES